MQTKNILSCLAAVAMAGESMASHIPHAHAHVHRELDARRWGHHRHRHVQWVTVWETETVFAYHNGEIQTASPDTFFSNDKPEPVEEVVPAVPTTVEEEEEEEEVAPTTPTTLVTKASPTEPPKETAVVVEDAVVEEAVVEQPDPVVEQKPDPVVEQTPDPVVVEQPDPVEQTPDPVVEQPPPVIASSGKRGFAYNDAKLVSSFAATGNTKVSWAYNWDSQHHGLPSSVDFVPMLWGDQPRHTDRWHANVNKMLDEGATSILSFNEPDHPDQAHMDPKWAARAHVEYMNPYGSRARIGSPGVTSADESPAGWGAQWLDTFMQECKTIGCQVDFCVTHWYGPAGDFEWMIKHVEKVHEVCEGRPVWVTEFAPFGSDEEIAEFVAKSIDRFESMPWLERYSYFMMSVGSLMSSTNSPSRYGTTYFDYTPSA